jgi:tryptophan synthase alpha chain
MSRIADTFSELSAVGRKALVPYITAGHPAPALTVPVMHALVAGGANVIELGVPFSDPMADGPTIQRSNEKALALGIGLTDVLQAVRTFRETDDRTPVVLMGYANPIERMGPARFADAAAAAGVDGVTVVDYPPEESASFAALVRERGIDPIFLLAPTSTQQRIADVLALASGYVYYVSLKGITGGTLDVADVRQRVAGIRERTALPVGVGFGIRDPETARAVGEVADAVIIGTRMIQLLEEGDPAEAPARARAFAQSIRAALDGIRTDAPAAAAPPSGERP